jgi:hypothetical protein
LVKWIIENDCSTESTLSNGSAYCLLATFAFADLSPPPKMEEIPQLDPLVFPKKPSSIEKCEYLN